MEYFCVADIQPRTIKDPLQNLILQGQCSIAGVVKKNGITMPCRVRLYEKLSGLKIDEKLTDNNGEYYFSGLNPINFFLVAHDPTNNYNAVIQDNVVPK